MGGPPQKLFVPSHLLFGSGVAGALGGPELSAAAKRRTVRNTINLYNSFVYCTLTQHICSKRLQVSVFHAQKGTCAHCAGRLTNYSSLLMLGHCRVGCIGFIAFVSFLHTFEVFVDPSSLGYEVACRHPLGKLPQAGGVALCTPRQNRHNPRRSSHELQSGVD